MTFGTVTVSDTMPDADTLAVNVNAGRAALVRAADALMTPGVALRLRADVPRFRADADQPGVLIRELNGAVERGKIVGGAFVAAD